MKKIFLIVSFLICACNKHNEYLSNNAIADSVHYCINCYDTKPIKYIEDTNYHRVAIWNYINNNWDTDKYDELNSEIHKKVSKKMYNIIRKK